MPRNINLIVIHCSATANGDGLFKGQSGQPGFRTALDAIDAMHAARGFHRTGPTAKTFNPAYQHVGYHFIIACNGAVLTGRHLDEIGAHAQGNNAKSVGICMTGTDQFTPDQWRALADLLRQIAPRLGVPLAPPKRVDGVLQGGVCGHRDLSPDLNGDGVIQKREWVKTCPGFDVAGFLAGELLPSRDATYLGAAK